MSRTAVINVLSENTRQAELFEDIGETLYYQIQAGFYESGTLVFSKAFRIEIGISSRQKMFLPELIRLQFKTNILDDEYFTFSKWRKGTDQDFEITINDESGLINEFFKSDNDIKALLGISERAEVVIYRSKQGKNNPDQTRPGLII